MAFRIVRAVLIGLVLSFLLACGYLYFNQTKLIFPSVHKPGEFEQCEGMKALGFEAKQMNGIRFFHRPNPHPKGFLFFIHGNGSIACDSHWLFSRILNQPLDFIAYEYPGYAGDTRTPAEKIILEEVTALFDEVRGKVKGTSFVFGKSLGSGPAVYLAANRKVDRLILEAPYDSVADIGQDRYPIIPVRLLTRSSFSAKDWAPKVQSKTLIYLAETDNTIPRIRSTNFIRALTNSPTVVELPLAGHNNMSSGESAKLYWDEFIKFISENQAPLERQRAR